MLRELAERLTHLPDQYKIAILVGFVLLIAWIFGRAGRTESQFKLRESDRLRAQSRRNQNESDLGDSKINKPKPLMLEGISLNGAAHEILGVSKGANKSEIESAYRELMKRYHPDKIGRPGSREWKDAQAIATKLNEARQEMLNSNT